MSAAVGRLAAAYGTLRGAQAAISVGIDRAESTRRLAALAKGFNEVGLAQGAAARAAQKFGLSQTEATQQFAQIYARLRPVGVQLQDIETAFNGFNTAAKLSGTSASEASSAWLQLGQALGSGVLRGEELNSVFEQTPAIVQAIAKEMNVPIGQIRQYAQDGKITSDIVIRALKRIETEGVAGLESAMNSPTQKLKEFQNQWENLQVALTTGVLPAITKVIGDLATKIQGLTGEVERTGKAFDIIAQSPVVQFFTSLAGGIADAARELDRFVGIAEFFQRNPSASFGPVWAAIAGLREKFLGANGVGTSASGANGMGGRYVPGDQQQLWTTPTPPPRTPAAAATGSSSTQRRLQGLQGRYIQGGYGPGGANAYGAHFDIKRVDGSYFNRSELDRYVSVNGRALSSGVTVPGGQFGASRDGGRRTHNAWDYAFGNGAALTLKGGAKWQSTSGSSYGDVAVFQTPDGKFYRIIHGKFEKTGDQAETISDQLQAQLDQDNAIKESLQSGEKLRTTYQRQLDLLNAQDETLRERLRIDNDYADRQNDINKLLDDKQKKDLKAINDKIRGIELLKLETDELEKQRKIIDDMQGGGYKNFSGGNIDSYTSAGQAMAASKQQLDDLLNPINQVVAGATAIGDAFGESFRGLVSGAMTAQEALANFFQRTADHFIDMAARIAAAALQHAIISAIFRGATGAITGGFNFGGGGINWGQTPSIGGVPDLPGLTPFATGGIVTGPTPALIGEAGPEAVIPLNKMGEAMQRFNPGKAEAGRAAAGGSGDGSSGSDAPPVLNITTGPVLNFEGKNYVSREDFQQGLYQAAKQGGELGEARTLRKLQHSASARRKLGMA